MPQFAGSQTPQNSAYSLSDGLAGINALNLRNLGAVRSLVLLDGRRITPSAITGIVDINTIPQQLVKRVDVVTGGASAQYGSDAVAGVTNFVLDKTYTGHDIKIEVNPDFVRPNEIKELCGDITLLSSLVGETSSKIPLRDTLKWMLEAKQ